MRPEQHGPWTAQDRSKVLSIEPRRLTLIAASAPGAGPKASISTTEPGFGNSLRLERERRQITLKSVAAKTKIGLGLLEGLERDDLSRWPGGIFRRAFIRAYSEAIGLDADQTTRSFFDYIPDPAETHSVLARSRGPADAGRTASGEALRLTLANTGLTFIERRTLVSARKRWAAAAWDLGVILAIGVLLFVFLHKFWIPLAITMLGYYGASIALLGNTLGASLFAGWPRGQQDS
jgi:transcriptional regulator with XRE-family HTH domain